MTQNAAVRWDKMRAETMLTGSIHRRDHHLITI